MLKIWSKLTGSAGLRSAILVSTGNIGATMFSAVAMIIFSRALGPEGFGVFSVLFSLLLILSKVGDLGINIAVQRRVAQNQADLQQIMTYTRAGSALKLLITLVVAVVGLLTAPWITTSLLHLSKDTIVLVRLVFILSGGVVFYEYVTTILQGVQSFGLSVLSNWIQSLTKLIYAIIIYFAHTTSLLYLTFLYLFAPILGGMAGFVRLRASYFVPLWDVPTLKRILAVSKWTGIAIVSATIADNVDVLLVQNMLSSYDTGLYSAAVRIASLAALVGWSLGTVLNVRVAQYHDLAHLRSYLKKAVSISLASFIGIALLVFLSVPAITYTVGPDFLGAQAPLNLLLFSTAILTASTPYVALFYLFDKPSYYAYSGILGTVVLLVADVLLIPRFGLIGAGYARILTRAAVLIFTLYSAKIAYKEKYA